MTSSMFTLLSFFLVLTCFFLCNVDAAEEACTTPENNPGRCIRLSECPPLMKIKNSRPYTSAQEALLKSSICGFEDKVYAKLCCPLLGTEDRSLHANPEDDFFDGPRTSRLLPDVSVCGIRLFERIAGGTVAALGAYPWMALLQYETPKGRLFGCGGSLINERYVLTAAHCVTGLHQGWSILNVRLGEHNITSEKDCFEEGDVCFYAQDFEVEKVIVYEKYDPKELSQHHDIALLRLARHVTFSDSIKPLCIPPKNILNETTLETPLIVTGWGATETKIQSDALLEVTIHLRPNSDCTNLNINFRIGKGQLCAGGRNGQDSCKGDSGGPVIIQHSTDFNVNAYIVGIVSFGPEYCGSDVLPGIYTKVSKYVPWIVSKLEP